MHAHSVFYFWCVLDHLGCVLPLAYSTPKQAATWATKLFSNFIAASEIYDGPTYDLPEIRRRCHEFHFRIVQAPASNALLSPGGPKRIALHRLLTGSEDSIRQTQRTGLTQESIYSVEKARLRTHFCCDLLGSR